VRLSPDDVIIVMAKTEEVGEMQKEGGGLVIFNTHSSYNTLYLMFIVLGLCFFGRTRHVGCPWHPTEGTLLVTGSYDKTVTLVDARSADTKQCKRVKIVANVESIQWWDISVSFPILDCRNRGWNDIVLGCPKVRIASMVLCRQ
jgi:hypothetical protein